MLKKLTTTAIATSALVAGGLVASAVPASAASVGASCSALGYKGTGNVLYSTSGGRHYISAYEWNISGQAGSTQNDVSVVLRRDQFGTDSTLHGFASGSERNGYNYTSVNLNYASSWDLYGTFTFVFDVNNLPDPSCSDETARF